MNNISIPDFLKDIQQAINCEVYLVGGAVRDLLLNLETADFDLLVNQNAIDITDKLQENNLVKVISVHEPFGTAKFQWLVNNKIIDIASTRTEYYNYPGALPIVNYPVNIIEDLKRRDFTINAIAYSLDTGEYTDIYNGRDDLINKTIKVLHLESYKEDPTRILRAIRFAVRFNFNISERDLELIEEVTDNNKYKNFISKIRGLRFGIELRRILEPNNWIEGVKLLNKLNIWDLLNTGLEINSPVYLNKIISWEYRLFSLVYNSSWDIIQETMSLLGVTKQINKILEIIYKFININNIQNISFKEYKLMAGLPVEAKELLFSLNNYLAENYNKLEQAVPEITPQELIAQGVKPQDITSKLEELFTSNIK